LGGGAEGGRGSLKLFQDSADRGSSGHASIILTLDVYSHVLPDMQEATAEKLEALIFRKAVMQ
jgi:hypothetical protein